MKKRNFVKRKWVIILAAMVMILLVRGTMAIYTSQVYQRAVVRNRYNDVIRFSSDKLYRVTDVSNPQKYYYPVSENQTTMTFSVCNYDQAKNTLFSEKEIGYTISFRVEDGTPGFDYTVSSGSISKTLQNNGTLYMTDSLAGGKRSVNTYSVTFNDEGYNKVRITVKVTPTDSGITQNYILNGVLIPVEYATTQGVRVKCEFTDSTRGTPDQFDAYNLLVSVSGGTGNVLITWDHTVLDIDPFFKGDKQITTEGNNSTITVHMDSENATGTYLISFYNHSTAKPVWTKWEELPISVRLE